MPITQREILSANNGLDLIITSGIITKGLSDGKLSPPSDLTSQTPLTVSKHYEPLRKAQSALKNLTEETLSTPAELCTLLQDSIIPTLTAVAQMTSNKKIDQEKLTRGRNLLNKFIKTANEQIKEINAMPKDQPNGTALLHTNGTQPANDAVAAHTEDHAEAHSNGNLSHEAPKETAIELAQQQATIVALSAEIYRNNAIIRLANESHDALQKKYDASVAENAKLTDAFISITEKLALLQRNLDSATQENENLKQMYSSEKNSFRKLLNASAIEASQILDTSRKLIGSIGNSLTAWTSHSIFHFGMASATIGSVSALLLTGIVALSSAPLTFAVGTALATLSAVGLTITAAKAIEASRPNSAQDALVRLKTLIPAPQSGHDISLNNSTKQSLLTIGKTATNSAAPAVIAKPAATPAPTAKKSSCCAKKQPAENANAQTAPANTSPRPGK